MTSECTVRLCPCKLLGFTPNKRRTRKLMKIIDNYLPKEVEYVGNER